MGLAKKGSKTIVISDVGYRWVVSPDSGYMRAVDLLRLGFLGDDGRWCRIAYFDWLHWWANFR